MNARQLGMIAIAALLLIGGLSAVGAASPADQASTDATDAYDANASVDGEQADATAENESDGTDAVGPSDGLPAQVPQHVSGIHDSIESFLNGSIENLGDSLNGLLDGGEAAGSAAENPADAAIGGN